MLMGSATSDALVLAKTWTAQRERATKEIAVKICIIDFSKLLPDVVVVLWSLMWSWYQKLWASWDGKGEYLTFIETRLAIWSLFGQAVVFASPPSNWHLHPQCFPMHPRELCQWAMKLWQASRIDILNRCVWLIPTGPLKLWGTSKVSCPSKNGKVSSYAFEGLEMQMETATRLSWINHPPSISLDSRRWKDKIASTMCCKATSK